MGQDKDQFIAHVQKASSRIAALAKKGRTEEIESLAMDLHYRSSLIRARERNQSLAVAEGFPDVDADTALPLEILQSAAAKRYARALRHAAECAAEVDAERGWTGDGLADFIDDLAVGAEEEAFGPKGLRGLE